MAILLKSQHNAWIHATATVLVFVGGFCVRLSRPEWCWILLALMAVWMAEALNTAIEYLADAVSPQRHPLIEKAKDVAAGAVLISAMGAATIGLLIFGPHVLKWMEST
jgi:diacylglycerol kinase